MHNISGCKLSTLQSYLVAENVAGWISGIIYVVAPHVFLPLSFTFIKRCWKSVSNNTSYTYSGICIDSCVPSNIVFVVGIDLCLQRRALALYTTRYMSSSFVRTARGVATCKLCEWAATPDSAQRLAMIVEPASWLAELLGHPVSIWIEFKSHSYFC